MEFTEGSKDIYIIRIALPAELLSKQLSSNVTAEDMTELLVKQRKKTQQVQLWEYEQENFDDTNAKNFLNMEGDVNTSLKMRDVEFEAKRLHKSPETMPPWFKHPMIIRQVKRAAWGLRDQLQQTTGPKFLGLQGVVMAVVKKVLQGFLLPLQCTSVSMPSQQLSNYQPQNNTESDSPEAPALSPPVSPPAIIAVQYSPTSSQTESALLSTPRRNPHSLFAPLIPMTIDPNSCDVFNAPEEQPTLHFDPATTVTSAPLLPVASPDDEALPLSYTEPMQQPPLGSETDKAVILSLTLLSESASILHGDDVFDVLIKDPVVISAQPAHHTIFNEPPVITKQDVPSVIQDESKRKTGVGLYDFLNCLFCCCVPPEDDYSYF